MIDEDGKPTPDALEKLRTWNPSDKKGFLDFASMLIIWPGHSIFDGNIYIFVTGGFSGNEYVIYAMMENKALWDAIRVPSTKGGYYSFALNS